MRKSLFFFIMMFFLMAGPEAEAKSFQVKDPNALSYEDMKVGTGQKAKTGSLVSVHYTGWLSPRGEKGMKFDSSLERGSPFQFPLGQGRVIPGWERGLEGMRVGGKRLLWIPARLAYGSRGAGAIIPPDSNLLFEVELLDARRKKP